MRCTRKTAHRAVLVAAAAAAMSSVVAPRLAAGADRTWDGFFTSQWTTPSNWLNTAEPQSADNANFRNQAGINNSVVILNANRTIANMNVDGIPSTGAYEFQSQN